MRKMVNRLVAFMACLTAPFAVTEPLRAQTISNTASIQWQAGAATVVRPSNQVDIAVQHPVSVLTLSTFQFSNATNATKLPVPQTTCRTDSGDVPVTLDGAFSLTPLNPASVAKTTQIHAGEPLVIGIASSADNLDPNAVDTLTATLTTPGGDSETLTLRETGPNTALFVGLIPTAAIPPTPVRGDCQLSLQPGDKLELTTARTKDGSAIATSAIEVLVDPYGVVFDSGDGTPVNGARVTLIDVATGQPAVVFGDDAVSHFPASVITGGTVTDGSGAVFTYPVGEYRFPFVRPGHYKVIVEPPPPYTAPSLSSPAELAGLRRPDGLAFALGPGSYAQDFLVDAPEPVRVDVPVDKAGAPLSLTKTASVTTALPGDAIQYKITIRNGDAARATGVVTITDHLPDAMRLTSSSVRYNGLKITYSVTSDGHDLTVAVPALAAGTSGTLTYLLEVRPDASPGDAMNRASAIDSRGTKSPLADAVVRINRDAISDRMTIIGRITDGGCSVDPGKANGIGGVRVMLEDGSYAVTDIDGRYHFEGVTTATHVVQFDPSTLGPALVPADCTQNARSAGSAISRFVEGQGGALIRVDFRAQTGVNTQLGTAATAKRAAPITDAAAAGADRDWFLGQEPGIGWIYPDADYNPRVKAIRVAIKHLPGQHVVLMRGGVPVDALAYDGDRKDGSGQIVVSLWRALDLSDGDTMFTAEVRDDGEKVVERLSRTIHYSSNPMHAELVREKSILVADGVTRPVIAVRLTDRAGRPVHHGVVGDFEVPAPYFPAVEADAQAARQLSGLERARPVYRTEGEDGMAYIELEPTTASGALTITLPFRDGEVARRQTLDTWMEPGNRPWTVVGFAAGTVGFNTLKGNLDGLGKDGEHWMTDARLALYAKGRVQGKWLMTLAYDTDKTEDQTRFGGTIDPTAYYTVYADRSERRYDAASVRKLYLRLERPQFYALFGDYETALGQTQLTRYVRSFNGLKAQYSGKHIAATAFAADTPYRHRREELQGNGLSGPYALAARDILPNSERITIETRDRFRSERIIESRTLVRNIDYDIDYAAGTLRFREPILSRSSLLDPQFIVADYEVNGVAQRVTNAGGRATWSNTARTLVVGASAIHDEDDQSRRNLGGVDVRYAPDAQTEVRAEFAASHASARSGSTTPAAGGATAWLVEAEHHGAKYDVLAYVRQQQTGFGVDQLNASETGTRKFGVDGRLRLSPALSLIGSGWQEEYLGTGGRRQAGSARVEYRGRVMDLRAGLQVANDTLATGETARSTIAQLGATRRLLNNKLELDAQTEFALGGQSSSVDFPARHKFSARYAINPDVTLVGSYEIARGKAVDANTARVGFDLKPWAGARLTATANRQDIAEYGPRSFAAYGLAQSLPIGKRWTVDLTLDGSKTLGGINPARVLNPAQPVASGGIIGTDGTLTEDFTAVTAGASYRGDHWSWTGRAEVRNGDRSNRYGLTTSALRTLGEGRALGGTFNWFRARDTGGATTETANMALSWANRPDTSRISWLEKLELRSDRITGAILGQAGPIGGAPSLVTGNAVSKRMVNSLSLNWSPVSASEGRYLGRSEVSLFWGSRYVSDRIDADDLSGWSNVVGADIRFDLSQTIDLGVSGTVRESAGGRALSFAGGPSLGVAPFHNGYISLGYNVVGYKDRDYNDARYTRAGPYVTLRFKFDQNTLAGLGIGR